MVGAPKGFSKIIVSLAFVTLLNSLASSFILPHISRTDDAIIVDCIANYFSHHSWIFGRIWCVLFVWIQLTVWGMLPSIRARTFTAELSVQDSSGSHHFLLTQCCSSIYRFSIGELTDILVFLLLWMSRQLGNLVDLVSRWPQNKQLSADVDRPPCPQQD